MRLDQYLSKVGLAKRRTRAKEMVICGLVEVNGKPAKPAYEIKGGDILKLGGRIMQTVEVIDIPSGNVKKEDRENYFKKLK